MTARILVLPGDGIGPEVMGSALDVLNTVATVEDLQLDITEDVLHGAAWKTMHCHAEEPASMTDFQRAVQTALSSDRPTLITVHEGSTWLL